VRMPDLGILVVGMPFVGMPYMGMPFVGMPASRRQGLPASGWLQIRRDAGCTFPVRDGNSRSREFLTN